MGKRQHQVIATLLIWTLCAMEAAAQALKDPMQPPGATSAQASTPPASGLQGVITSPGRKLALIDGQVVPLGSRVRDGTLAGLSGSGAIVKKKDGELDVLLMSPSIDKRPARRPGAQ